MALEKLEAYKMISRGGLDSNENYLELSDNHPGSATALVNFEPGLFGGYRRIEGFQPLEADYADVDDAAAEGKILGIAIYDGKIIAARKQKAGATYNFYAWTSGGDWAPYTTGLTLTSTGIDKIRYATFNFDSDEKVIFVDGVNDPIVFDGTTWSQPTGDQSLPAPKYVTVFENHIFVSGDSTDPHIVAHCAPEDETEWDTAGGAGQIIAGFDVKQIRPFRQELYVFGENDIKKILVESTDFVIKDVTQNIGCLAPDSVVEINGDLLFLSQDGFRTIAATERVGDIEVGNQSKVIQQDIIDLISTADLDTVDAVVIRRKSQVRFFFSDENLEVDKNNGILAALRGGHDIEHSGTSWEWAKLKGIRTSCATSGYIGTEEYVLHGDFNGKVYRQESGNSFDGKNIRAVYTTPYLDFGDVFIRKTIHKIMAFIRPEDETSINVTLQFDWDDRDVINPDTYLLEQSITGSVYGEAVYGTSTYAVRSAPVLVKNVEGSGFSVRITYSSNDMNAPYSIQGTVFEFKANGRK